MHRRELAAQQVELLAEPVQHPVHLAGLVAAQRLGELDRVDVGAGDTGGGQHRRRRPPGQRRQRLTAAEQQTGHTEQHDRHQDQHHHVQQHQRHGPILPYRPTAACRSLATRAGAGGDDGVHRRPIGQRHRRGARRVAVAVDEELGQTHAGVGDAAAREQGRDDLTAHRAQLGQRPVAVCPHTEVDLRDRVQAQPVVGVDQQADLDAVAGRERHRHQQFAGGRIFAAQRLQHTAQLGSQRREQRPRHQLGDPATAGGAFAAAGIARRRSAAAGRSS